MTSPVTEKAAMKNAWQMPKPWKYLREDLVLDNGHLLVQVLKRSGILPRIVHKEPGIILRKRCCWNLQKVDILLSVQHRKLSIHFAADYPSIDTVFRIIISANQLSIYGAVAALCEEFESHQDGSGEPEILMGQSIVLGEVKAEAPLQNENPMNDQIIWQQYIQQVESLSLENKVGEFSKEAGFVRVVEVGQYFVTKDTGNLRQFRSVACREYTLPRDDPTSEAKGWIQGNTRIGPVLEVTTSFQHFKYGIDIRIWSVNQDNSQILGQNILWNDQICGRFNSRQHRNSCGSTRRASTTNKHQSGCSQVKGKSKTSTESTRWYNSNHTKTWKKMDWHWTIRTKSCLVPLPPCSSRTFWKQSHWSYVTRKRIDWTWNISLHLPHRMCTQSSFYYQQWIDTWRSRFEQKTNSILLAHWSKRRKSQSSWTYWLLCTTSSAIRAQCMEEAPRRGILGWYWSCDQRRINILSNTIECNCPSRNTSSLLHSKKLWDWKLEKSCMKDDTCLLNHHQRSHWDTITIGPEGMINWVLQLNNSQLENSFNSLLEKHHVLIFQTNPIQTQSNLWSIGETWGHRTCFCGERKNVRSQEIDDKRLQKGLGSSDRTGKPVKLSEDTSSSTHTQWKNLFLTERIVTLHHLTRTTSSTLQLMRRTSTSTSQACQIRGWNDHMASTFTT